MAAILGPQVVRCILGELISDPDPARSQRFMEAMMQMRKIEMEPLQQAYEAA